MQKKTHKKQKMSFAQPMPTTAESAKKPRSKRETVKNKEEIAVANLAFQRFVFYFILFYFICL